MMLKIQKTGFPFLTRHQNILSKCANKIKVDTSNKRQISGQSITVVKCCMYCSLIWEVLPLVMEEHLLAAEFLRNLSI